MPPDKAQTMTERYEHIRAMRRMQQQTQEMEIMIGSGMHGWMEAWAEYGSPDARAQLKGPCSPACPPTLLTPVSLAVRGEAVGILTAMIWDIVKEDTHVYDT
jgi:hypothetical protein